MKALKRLARWYLGPELLCLDCETARLAVKRPVVVDCYVCGKASEAFRTYTDGRVECLDHRVS